MGERVRERVSGSGPNRLQGYGPAMIGLRLPPSPGLKRLLVMVALTTVVGVFLGLVGPFGSYNNGSAPVRIAYFTGTFWIASLMYAVALPAVARAAGGAGVPAWFWVPVATAVVAAPVAAVSRVAATALWPWVDEYVGLGVWYLQSLTLSAAAVGAALLIRRNLGEASASIQPGEALAPRGPSRADVLCLQMEDHYVRVHTPSGSELILMPMAQAITELTQGEGLRVHRSWWVARRAVEAVVPAGRGWRIRLRGGLEAPVSRARIADLRQAGWL